MWLVSELLKNTFWWSGRLAENQPVYEKRSALDSLKPVEPDPLLRIIHARARVFLFVIHPVIVRTHPDFRLIASNPLFYQPITGA